MNSRKYQRIVEETTPVTEEVVTTENFDKYIICR